MRNFVFCTVVLNFCQFVHASDLCTDIDEISIKGTVSVYGNVLQKVSSVYQLNRALYGIFVKYSFPTQYTTHDQWLSLMNDTSENAVDFTTIDTDFNDDDRLLFPNYLAIPLTFGKFLFVYNLPNVTTTITLSIDVIVEIMLQKVTFWNDTPIQDLNPTTDLPEMKIQLIAANGSTVQNYYLSYYLSHYSQKWRTVFGDDTFYSWPSNNNSKLFAAVIAPSIVGTVNEKPYSFSYTTWNFFTQMPLPYVKLVKIADVKKEDVLSSWPPAIKNVWTDTRGIDAYFNTTPMLSESGALYPFIFFQHAIVKMSDKIPKKSCCIIQEILGLIDYIFSCKFDPAQYLSFYPLPGAAVQYIRSAIMMNVTCRNEQSFEEYKKYETLEAIARRKQSIMIIAPSTVGALLLIIIIVLLAYYRRIQMIREKFWIIGSNEIKIDSCADDRFANKSWLNVQNPAKERSLSMLPVPLSAFQHKRDGEMAFYITKNKDVSIFKLSDSNSPNSWRRTTKMAMANFCKNVTHINVSMLHGIWIADVGNFYTVSEPCEKGSLNYVLATCPYTLSIDMKYIIAHDVIKGLNYLHNKGIVHGSMNSYSCEVDSLWTVKLTNWSCNSIWKLESAVVFESMDFSKIEEIQEIIKLLYVDPEAIKPGTPTFASDVYGYGMLLVEIFNQQTPFFEEVELSITNYQNLLRNKQQQVYDIPTMNDINVPNNLQKLINHLITRPSNGRKDSAGVLKTIQEHRGNSSKNIVDIVMKSLESHVAHLEEKVTERTVELTNMTSRMKDLLNQLLPPQIATQFINGEAVQPEFYECATIVFSDIVGFTTISARSTPIQVMAFLNELWKEFDSVAEKFDVYKVDTIGDAYMVASGLPIRNGVNHCKHSADLSLALLRLTNTFRIPHLQGEQLKIRLGINSGPVTAGIVGFKMPQYCVFGDTVNTASRMESTSLPFKIQVSEQFQNLAASYFPNYEFEYRGETQIKGKGIMKTYWLMGNQETDA